MKIIYMATDGSKFDNQSDCEEYEQREREHHFKDQFLLSPIKLMSDNGNNIFEKIIEDPVWVDQMDTIYIRENVIEWIDKLLEFAQTEPWDGWFPLEALYDARAYEMLNKQGEILISYDDADDEWKNVFEIREKAQDHIEWIRKRGR